MGPTIRTAVFVLVSAGGITQNAVEQPFRPFSNPAYVSVNAVAFGDGGRTLYAAMFVDRIEKARGRTPAAGTPELAIYESRRGADGSWGEPAMLPFSGRWSDYEPTLSPDGSYMVFNSQRPLQDGGATGPNNLWLVRRTAAGWGSPMSLAAINRAETEESYPAITSDGRIFYVQETTKDAAGADYNINVAQLSGDRVSPPVPVSAAATSFGDGDPWVAADGCYLIFPRWDRSREWQTGVDLYITFARGRDWTAPVELSVAGAPDYAVTIDGAEPTIYFRRTGGLVMRPWAPILAAARKSVKN